MPWRYRGDNFYISWFVIQVAIHMEIFLSKSRNFHIVTTSGINPDHFFFFFIEFEFKCCHAETNRDLLKTVAILRDDSRTWRANNREKVILSPRFLDSERAQSSRDDDVCSGQMIEIKRPRCLTRHARSTWTDGKSAGVLYPAAGSTVSAIFLNHF